MCSIRSGLGWAGLGWSVHGGAVRVGDDAVVVSDRVAVHLGDDERCVRVHAEDGRIVDDDAAGLNSLRRPLLQEEAAGARRCEWTLPRDRGSERGRRGEWR